MRRRLRALLDELEAVEQYREAVAAVADGTSADAAEGAALARAEDATLDGPMSYVAKHTGLSDRQRERCARFLAAKNCFN